MADGVVGSLQRGRDAVGKEGQGVISGRWQNRELGAGCATQNPASWLVAWRCETTHRARPGGELLPGNHFSKGHLQRNNVRAHSSLGPRLNSPPNSLQGVLLS